MPNLAGSVARVGQRQKFATKQFIGDTASITETGRIIVAPRTLNVISRS